MAEGNPNEEIIPVGGIRIGQWPFARWTAISIGDGAVAEEAGIAIGYESKSGKGGCAIGEAVVAKDHEFVIGPWNIGELVKQG